MRVTLADNWFTFYPDKQDPITKAWMCRYCGSPVVKGHGQQKTFYCSDDHRFKHFNETGKYTWDYIRHLIFIRDNGRCRNCGKKLVFTLNECDRGREDLLAEIHHLTPVVELDDVAWKASREAENSKRDYWYLVFRIILQNDLNNLITLCRHPCHDLAHNHLNNKLRKNNRNTIDKY